MPDKLSPMPSVWQPDAKLLTQEQIALATPQEQQAYLQFLKIQTALQSPLDYAMYVSPETEEYPHILLLNTLLVALVEHRLYPQEFGPCPHATATDPKNGRVLRSGHPADSETGGCFVPEGVMPVDRLFVTMPPRHGKSYLISEHFSPWYLSRYPNRNILLASYEADFAATWGKKAKDHVQAHPEFGISTDPESQAKANWKLDKDRGGMATAGAGGPLTGKGGMLIIDDPIKNAEEAKSELDRENKYDWFASTAITRLEPGGVCVLVHTRWHDEDLGGRLMKEEPHKWFHIDLPALQPEENTKYDENGIPLRTNENPLQRAAGEALCPMRFDREYLEGLRASNARWFGALYQQRPTDTGTGLFQAMDFRYWRPQAGIFTNTDVLPDANNAVYVLHDDIGDERYVLKSKCKHFMTIDLAASKKTSADFTVFATWAASPDGDLILLDRIRERMESADHMLRLQAYWTAMKRNYPMLFIGIEKATFGLTLITNARRAGLPTRELKPDTDKVTRAIPAGAMVSGHKVFFPRVSSWLEEWEHEIAIFDNGAHDDQVDVLAYAAFVLQSGQLMLNRKPKEKATTLEERLEERLSRRENRRKHRFQHPELGKI